MPLFITADLQGTCYTPVSVPGKGSLVGADLNPRRGVADAALRVTSASRMTPLPQLEGVRDFVRSRATSVARIIESLCNIRPRESASKNRGYS